MLLNLTGSITVYVNMHKILFDITEDKALCTADENEYSTNILVYMQPRILPLKNTASLFHSLSVRLCAPADIVRAAGYNLDRSQVHHCSDI